MTREEYISLYQKTKDRYVELIQNIDINLLEKEKKDHEKTSLESDFWTDNLKAKKTLKIISTIEKEIKEFNQLKEIYFDISDDVELLNLGELLSDEMIKRIDLFIDSLSKYETRKMLNGENDHLGAIISIHPGAVDTPFWDTMASDFKREEMLNSVSLAQSIVQTINAPGNLTVEEMVVRRVKGDF